MKSKEQTQQRKLSNVNSQLLIGAALNGAIVIVAIMMSWYILAASWTIGILVVFPFFGAVRQLLEHRGEYAHKSQDYTLIPHGEVNRMFGDGPLASTLGAAGFNRHLLHSWETGNILYLFQRIRNVPNGHAGCRFCSKSSNKLYVNLFITFR